MTNEQVLDMVSMRLNGSSLQEIGDKYGYSREYVRKWMPQGLRGRIKSELAIDKTVYPALKEWLIRRDMPISVFSKMCKVNKCTMDKILHGEVSPTKSNIDKILSVTGFTYEHAFKVDD